MARWTKDPRECCQHARVIRKHEPGLTFCWCADCKHGWIEMPMGGS